jgi:sugar phosphate isomerase/epimerase
MRLAISNIAWKPHEREAVYAILADEGVRGLEIAPAHAFAGEPEPVAPSAAAVRRFMREIERRRLELVSMQSLLFGVPDARLFGSKPQHESFERGLARAVALAGRLGIPNLVMGSPANRAIPDSMDRAQAEQVAIDVFRRIGDLCLEAKAKLAVEPNPPAYGTNFLNTIGETLTFVQQVGHPAVSITFDIGSLLMNGETDAGGEYFGKARALVSHVHVSEANLALAPQDVRQFEALARAILAHGYGGWFSIEMRAVEDDNLARVRDAVAACSRTLTAADQQQV